MNTYFCYNIVCNNAIFRKIRMTLVHNINGTSKNKRNIPWIDFWREKTSRKGKQCKNVICDNEAEVGAHVQKHGKNTSDSWFITPLCKKCNSKTDTFTVLEKNLIPVNSKE